MEVIMPKSTMPEQAVTFKGIEQGILILLDTSHDFEKLIKLAIQKIKSNKKFLSENTLFVRGAAGPLDPDELGMARKLIRDKTKMEVLPLPWKNEKQDSEQDPPSPIISFPPPLLASNALRAGQELRSDGDVILLGNMHPGSQIYAKGSVYIYGFLRGEVYAGIENNPQAVVVCKGFAPLQLSIGGINLPSNPDPSWLKHYVFVSVKDKELLVALQNEFEHE
jgi:septum site-determining protein MinC